MSNRTIGTKLRMLREKHGMSVKAVLELLEERGIEISNKTFYSYENNSRAIGTETFLALCEIYNVKSVLQTFGGEKPDYSVPSDREWEFIERYRRLDHFGVDAVDSVLNAEYARCRTHGIYDFENLREINYYRAPASAGPGQILFDDIDVDQIYIPDDPEYKRVAYAVECRGDSMEPKLHDGDILLIEPTTDLRVGEIGIFYIDGNSYVKKLGRGELLSLNPAYAPIHLSEGARCMGRVIDRLDD